jgi:hypothetical protein
MCTVHGVRNAADTGLAVDGLVDLRSRTAPPALIAVRSDVLGILRSATTTPAAEDRRDLVLSDNRKAVMHSN